MLSLFKCNVHQNSFLSAHSDEKSLISCCCQLNPVNDLREGLNHRPTHDNIALSSSMQCVWWFKYEISFFFPIKSPIFTLIICMLEVGLRVT